MAGDVLKFARSTGQIVPAYREAFELRATVWRFDCGCVLGQRRSSLRTFEMRKFDFLAASCGSAEHERAAGVEPASPEGPSKSLRGGLE